MSTSVIKSQFSKAESAILTIFSEITTFLASPLYPFTTPFSITNPEFCSFISIPPKIKSAPTEADAQKTQTPVVAKLTQCEMRCTYNYISQEFAFLSNSECDMQKQDVDLQNKKHTYFHNYSVSLAISF